MIEDVSSLLLVGDCESIVLSPCVLVLTLCVVLSVTSAPVVVRDSVVVSFAVIR